MTLLDKRGNSNTQERIDLLAGFIKQFGKISILGLLADREFVGEKWFNYLKNEGIDFIIRIKKNAKTTNSQGQEVPVQNLFLHLKLAEQLTLEDSRLITGVKAVSYTHLDVYKRQVYTVLVNTPFDKLPEWIARWSAVDKSLLSVVDINKDGILQLAELTIGGDIIVLALSLIHI